MSLNLYQDCRVCHRELLVDSIYSYEGYCWNHFPLPWVESEKDQCLSCLYYRRGINFCDSPLGAYVPGWWKGDVCLHPVICEFYRLDRRRFPDGI